jgi:hypothetical protein
MTRHALLFAATLLLWACENPPPESRTPPVTPSADAGAPAQPSSDVPDEPRFYVTYTLDRTGDNQRPFRLSEARQLLYESKLLETLANIMNQTVVLPRKVGIVSQPCKEDLAYYDPNTVSIHICDALVARFLRSFAHLPTPQERYDAVILATGFSMLHEIGHALIDLYDIPELGAEEDAADAIATVLLVGSPELEAIAQRGADGLLSLDADRDQPVYSDEHSVGAQRYFDINCLIYGSDPASHQWLLTQNRLPAKRAERCPGEWAKKASSLAKLLEPHRRRPASGGLQPAPKPILTRKR